MRRVLCYENALHFERFFVEGSVTWKDDKLPLVWNFYRDTAENILGHALDLQRDEDGAITAELVFLDPKVEALVESYKLPATFFANELKEEVCDGVRVFHSLLIREISIVPSNAVLW